MKINKKILVVAAGAVMSVSLVACGNGDKDVVTTNGGNITQKDYYNKMKSTPQGKTVLQTMIINKLLNKQYGNKVKKSDVDAQYKQYQKRYGKQMPQMMQQQGLTESSFKEQIKDNLLLKQAVIANTSFSDKEMQDQFKKDNIKKGSYKDYEPRLKEELATSKMADRQTTMQVISKLVKDGNVQIKEKDLQSVLTQLEQPQMGQQPQQAK